MEIQALTRNARMSPRKVREIANQIQGRPVREAVDFLTLIPRKSARLLAKTLKSAIANAENNANLRVEKLVVQEATVGEGPTLKRFQPKARGSAGPIRKRTSHIRIILTDEIEIKTRRSRSTGAKKKSKGRPAAKRQKGSATRASEGAASAPAAAETTTQSAPAAE